MEITVYCVLNHIDYKNNNDDDKGNKIKFGKIKICQINFAYVVSYRLLPLRSRILSATREEEDYKKYILFY